MDIPDWDRVLQVLEQMQEVLDFFVIVSDSPRWRVLYVEMVDNNFFWLGNLRAGVRL
jgi:hypothetical protein